MIDWLIFNSLWLCQGWFIPRGYGVIFSLRLYFRGGASSVKVIVVGNGHSDTSSNLGGGWSHLT